MYVCKKYVYINITPKKLDLIYIKQGNIKGIHQKCKFID